MLKKGLFIAFAALAFASEIEDAEQKKRGAGKANALNAIPTGPQKSDYAYNIYSQSSNVQNPSQSYQGQVPNSFYPNQASSQYYTPSSPEPNSNSLHTQTSPQSTQSQFVPINFIPSPGYQSKYQIVPPKQNGNLQLAFVQQPSIQSSMLQYPHSFFSPSHSSHIAPSAILGTHGQFSFGPAYHPLPLGGSFISQPSMIVLPQPHGSLYNSLLYPNPSQSFYNYYPSASQAKYSYASGATASQSNDYEKGQSIIPQTNTKEDNLNVANNDYINTDPSSAYKNGFTSRSSYSKL